MPRLLRLGLFTLLMVGLTAFSATHLKVTTDMSEMMPGGPHREQAELARAIARSQLSQTAIVSLETSSTEDAVAASQLFAQTLQDSPVYQDGIQSIQTGPPEGLERSLFETYQPRRLGFAAESPERAKQLVSPQGLERAVARLKERLLSPLSALVTRTAPADPFLALPQLFEALEKDAPRSFEVKQGRYVADGRFAIIFLELTASSFDADAQERVVQELERAFSSVQRKFPGARVEWSSFARFSVSAKRAIVSDVTRVSIVSSLVVVGLSLFLFRSLRMLLLAFTPIYAGMMAGLAALCLTVETVHGLTLAFGASLIGVCIDAVLHFYVHYLSDSCGNSPRAVMRRVAPAMALGGLTTMVGFVVLSRSALPGLSQSAIFGAVGVFFAYAVTFIVLPDLVPAKGSPSAALTRFQEVLHQGYRWLGGQRKALLVGSILAVLVTVLGGARVRFDSDFRALLSFDPALESEDARVRARVAQFDTSRFVVALGESDELALRNNEEVRRQLREAVSAGELAGFQSVSTLLPSERTQQQVADVMLRAQLQARLPKVLASVGFAEAAFSPFWDYLNSSEATQTLSYADVAKTPLSQLVDPHRVPLEEGVAWLTYLRGPMNSAALESRFSKEDEIVFVDQGNLMGELDHRPVELGLLFLGGFLLIVTLLMVRYRSGRRGLAALVPALLATMFTVSVVSLLGYRLNLVAVSALLMVLSMGADYGVFMAESADDPDGEPMKATLSALLLACGSTVVSFSVLALSSQQILQVIGLIAAIGVSSSFLLAVLSSLLVVHPNRRQGGRA